VLQAPGVFTIRGKLLIFALEIVAGAIMLSSMPPLVWWLQLTLAVVAVGVIALAAVLGRSIADGATSSSPLTRRIGLGEYEEPVLVRTNDEMGTLGVGDRPHATASSAGRSASSKIRARPRAQGREADRGAAPGRTTSSR